MPIATVLLFNNSNERRIGVNYSSGWVVEINGVTVSEKEKLRAHFPGTNPESEEGALYWTVTPPGVSSTGIPLPIDVMAKYLNFLDHYGYKVVSSDRTVNGHNDQTVLWTLQRS